MVIKKNNENTKIDIKVERITRFFWVNLKIKINWF
jgi:hypothetical protein